MAPRCQYGFKAWVEQHLGPGANAASVKRHFDALGVELTQEKWRVFLHEAPKRPDLNVWLDICDATGERLSTFIDYQPSGCPPERLKSLRESNAGQTRPALQVAEKAPPDPRRYFGGEC